MLLPDLVLTSRVNKYFEYSGADSPELCLDKTHFECYPHHIDYRYNSRGFRDHEWPDSLDELRQAIWCVGDSFTVGIGQPFNHIWPQILTYHTGLRTINVSLDGASNDWISRRALDIAKVIDPTNIILMWSYIHRRESQDVKRSDEQRRIYYVHCTDEQDFDHWQHVVTEFNNKRYPSIQCTIPKFDRGLISTKFSQLNSIWNDIKASNWPCCPITVQEYANLDQRIRQEIRQDHGCHEKLFELVQFVDKVTALAVPPIMITDRLDWARDHHHFDILTSQWLVRQIIPLLR